MGANEEIIDVEPTTDPATGATIWAVPVTDRLPAVPEQNQVVSVDGQGDLRVQQEGAVAHGIELTRERFAGEGSRLPAIGDSFDDWGAAEAAQNGGHKVVLEPDGSLRVAGGESTPATSVTLTDGKFAMGVGRSSTERLPMEQATVARLRDAGVRWIGQLAHTTTVRGMPAGAPVGWLYRPRPNKHGDRLVCVVAYHPTTRLYHCHLWRFDADVDGRGQRSIDLPRLIGRYPELTHHKAHLYTSADGSAVLCLSERISGGMPSLETALAQTMKWADGTGEVVRGRPFPYN